MPQWGQVWSPRVGVPSSSRVVVDLYSLLALSLSLFFFFLFLCLFYDLYITLIIVIFASTRAEVKRRCYVEIAMELVLLEVSWALMTNRSCVLYEAGALMPHRKGWLGLQEYSQHEYMFADAQWHCHCIVFLGYFCTVGDGRFCHLQRQRKLGKMVLFTFNPKRNGIVLCCSVLN